MGLFFSEHTTGQRWNRDSGSPGQKPPGRVKGQKFRPGTITAKGSRTELTWHWCWHGKISLHLAAHGLCLSASVHELHVPVHRWPHCRTAPHLIGHFCESRSQHLAANLCLCSRGHVNWTDNVHFINAASLHFTSCLWFSSSHERIVTYNSTAQSRLSASDC